MILRQLSHTALLALIARPSLVTLKTRRAVLAELSRRAQSNSGLRAALVEVL